MKVMTSYEDVWLRGPAQFWLAGNAGIILLPDWSSPAYSITNYLVLLISELDNNNKLGPGKNHSRREILSHRDYSSHFCQTFYFISWKKSNSSNKLISNFYSSQQMI